MRRLGERGTASWEFCLVAVPFFTLLFTIFDLGRYAITMQSLRALADSGARAVIINCYQGQAILKASGNVASCASSSYLPNSTAMQNAAPFLYLGGLTPTLTPSHDTSSLTITASSPDFTMMMPIWGTSLNAPTASTAIPF